MSYSRPSKPIPNAARSSQAYREKSGFSLIAVTAILVISSLWASAMMGAMLPTYEKLVVMKVASLARNSAEAGLDYTIGQLNTAFQPPRVASSLDQPTLGTTAKITTLPANLTGSTGAAVTVSVFNEEPPTSAMLYDPNIAKLVAQGVIANPFRRIESTASIGGMKKTIRVILAPIVSTPPYFPFAAFGTTAVNIVGPAAFDSYNLPATDPHNIPIYKNSRGFYNIYGNVGTKGSMIYNGDSVHPVSIGGSLFQFPAPDPNPAVQAALRAAIIAEFNSVPSQQYPWLQIYDNVYSNTDTRGYWPRGQYPARMNSWNNVNGWSDPGITDPSNPTQPGPNGVVSPYASYTQPSVQPAPTSPSGTFNLGHVRISNSAKLVFQDSTAPPSAPVGTLSSGTVTLPAGNYVMSSLTMTNTSAIEVKSSSPVSIYFEGVSSGASTAISIAKNVVVNMNSGSQSTNLILYYNGSKSVSLSGTEKAILYAPNSTVSVGNGLAAQANYYGSLVGGTIDVNGGHVTAGAFIHFDAAMRESNLFALNGAALGNQIQITGLKAVSWQEL